MQNGSTSCSGTLYVTSRVVPLCRLVTLAFHIRGMGMKRSVPQRAADELRAVRALRVGRRPVQCSLWQVAV